MANKQPASTTGRTAAAKTKCGDGFVEQALGNWTLHTPDHFSLHWQLGKGAFGVVAGGVNDKTGECVAVKQIRKSADQLCRHDVIRLLREKKIPEHMQHENILAVLDAYYYKNCHYIVFPRMDTDLRHIIYSNQPLTDEHVVCFARQLCSGVAHLHAARVLHRDLKPANLLINNNRDLKIADFGLARGVGSAETPNNASGPPMLCRQLTEYVVTRWFRSPEVCA